MTVQLAPATALNFTKATGDLKSMQGILISDKAKAREARYITELGIEPQKHKGGGGRGGGHPRNKRKKKGGGPGGLQPHANSLRRIQL
jgi:hypothetical protein